MPEAILTLLVLCSRPVNMYLVLSRIAPQPTRPPNSKFHTWKLLGNILYGMPNQSRSDPSNVKYEHEFCWLSNSSLRFRFLFYRSSIRYANKISQRRGVFGNII